jgi:hypothetical protein
MVKSRTPEEALIEIKEHSTVRDWVREARERNNKFLALVHGKNFTDYLIEEIERIESEGRKLARKKYSKDIRDMFQRVFKKRYNIFEAIGGGTVNSLEGKILEDFEKVQNNFKGNKSIHKYLSEYLFDLYDVDPNGLIFIEYNEDGTKMWPTYKSIQDIRHYETYGEQVPYYVYFEPKQKVVQTGEGQMTVTVHRYVDSEREYVWHELNGVFTLVKDQPHPFKSVPAVVVSDKIKVGSEIRLCQVDQIQPLAEDYARDKSIKTVYKFLNGFPIHWRYVQSCHTCSGSGRKGNEKCDVCDGSGNLVKGDVTDYVTVKPPRSTDDPVLTPNIAGYVNPSLDVWTQYNNDLKEMEKAIEFTIWGTVQVDSSRGNETATGRYIDTQPITNELSRLSSNVEYIHNTLIKFSIEFVTNGSKSNGYYVTYGRRFIIESPDVVLEKYQKAAEAGMPNVVLDRLLNEFIVAKYKNDVQLMNEMLKKAEIEPYVHWDVLTVNTCFGPGEAKKKITFNDWWANADKSLDSNELLKEFNTFVSQSNN